MLWSLALAHAGSWQHVTLYGLPDPPGRDGPRRARLLAGILALEQAIPRVVVRDLEAADVALEDLPDFALEAVFAVSHDADRVGEPGLGIERDLWVDGRLVVARRWPDGHFEIRRGPAAPYALPVGPTDLARRLGGRIRGPFTERERALLWLGFQRLHPEEQALLEGVTWRRRTGRFGKLLFAQSSAAMGSFIPTRPFITMWSGMYEEDVLNGAPSDPLPKGLWTLVHEVGHAVAWATWYEAARAGQAGQLDAAACAERANDEEPVLTAFLAIAPEGLTDYSGYAEHEAFADAFALYHLHPDFLEVASPETLRWFEQGGHLAWIDDPAWADCLRPGRLTSRSGVRPPDP